ncbi:MAG: AraC family transcriptional regulator [Capsulimonadales bacterium]|nr:AraC family transcriptional regulator [Capsulimonadales bacterium]
MDPLTEILSSFQPHSTVLHRGRSTAPWGAEFDPRRHNGADAAFHVVTEGECFLELIDGAAEPIRLRTGDFVLLPHGPVHRLRDSLATPARPIERVVRNAVRSSDGTVCFGGGGTVCGTVCGTFRLRHAATNPLLSSLPPVLIVRGEQGKAVPWLEATLAFLACESASERPGADTVIARLCDILFIQAIRAHLEQLRTICPKSGASTPGWLAALQDPEIARALTAIHRHPERNWTVETLAREAASSRSTFAARFSSVMGEPPLQYLTRWRVHRAAVLLHDSRLTVGEIAARMGYASEAAFHRTYRRWTGETPGAVRRRSDRLPAFASG